MIQISFIGDIMLGRFVAEKYAEKRYQLVSDNLLKSVKEADIRIANLESPISSQSTDDSLRFAASADLLEQFKWVDCFSLSNNHINDFGNQGMKETIEALDAKSIGHNGLFTEEYTPFLIEKNGERIAVVTCADMMNYEFSDDCPYQTLRVNKEEQIAECVKRYKEQGYFVILYAHVGMLFTRFPNPVIREFVHRMVDVGTDCVVTAHPHCLGGYEYYNSKLIVYSLGDFLMDGASFRRRRAGVLKLDVENGDIKNWSIQPVETTDELQVRIPNEKNSNKMRSDFQWVSKQIAKHSDTYNKYYKWQYKKELLAHSWSTLKFEFHRRGLKGLLRTLSKRFGAVSGMAKRVFTDRSKMSYDSDAISEKNTSLKDIR